MRVMAPQITSLPTVYLAVYSGVYQRKHQSPASLAFARGIHRGPVNSPHKTPVTREMFPFDDVIMIKSILSIIFHTIYRALISAYLFLLWWLWEYVYVILSLLSNRKLHSQENLRLGYETWYALHVFLRSYKTKIKRSKSVCVFCGMYSIEATSIAICWLWGPFHIGYWTGFQHLWSRSWFIVQLWQPGSVWWRWRGCTSFRNILWIRDSSPNSYNWKRRSAVANIRFFNRYRRIFHWLHDPWDEMWVLRRLAVHYILNIRTIVG